MKKTAVIGASTNPSRYSYKASHELVGHGHEVIPIGIKQGEVAGNNILDIRSSPDVEDIDTMTLYIGPKHQGEWIDYLLNLSPKRIIFNPGTENPQFMRAAENKGIEVIQACTLVMLSIGNY